MRDFILPVGHCIYSSVIRNLSVVSYSLYWWAYQPKLSATISLKIHISYPQFLNSDQVTGGNVKVGPKTRDKEDKWGFLSHDQSLNDGELSCEKGLKVSTWRSWNYRQRKVERKEQGMAKVILRKVGLDPATQHWYIAPAFEVIFKSTFIWKSLGYLKENTPSWPIFWKLKNN